MRTFSVIQFISAFALCAAVVIALFAVLGAGDTSVHIMIISVKAGFAGCIVRTGFAVSRTGKAGQFPIVPPITVFTASARTGTPGQFVTVKAFCAGAARSVAYSAIFQKIAA